MNVGVGKSIGGRILGVVCSFVGRLQIKRLDMR